MWRHDLDLTTRQRMMRGGRLYWRGVIVSEWMVSPPPPPPPLANHNCWTKSDYRIIMNILLAGASARVFTGWFAGVPVP